jgi:hypothetical protein
MGFEAACLEYEKVKDAVLRVEESHLFISLFALAVEEIEVLSGLTILPPPRKRHFVIFLPVRLSSLSMCTRSR